MNPSLKKFKDDFVHNLLNIHWKQWGCLGVASQLEEEKKWVIDIEALLSSTIFWGQFDKRLLSAAIEWVYEYGEWINVSRLKRIGAFFHKTDNILGVQLAPENIYYFVENASKKRKNSGFQQIQEQVIHYNLSKEYRRGLENFQAREIISQPDIQKTSLWMLSLRGFFGVNARAEVLLYLLHNKAGNSNHIAGEIQYDQKVVYRILERWTEAGFADKEKARKYILANPDQSAKLPRPPEGKAKYLNWADTFHALARIMKSLHTEPWESDSYLLSSFFRQTSDVFKSLARETGVVFSEKSLYKGKSYLSPFMKSILNILEKF